MKVLELAKEFDKSSDDILKMLKSLKLKAKDANQELVRQNHRSSMDVTINCRLDLRLFPD